MIHDRDLRGQAQTPMPAPASRPTASTVPAWTAAETGEVVVGPTRFGELRETARLQRRAFRPALAYGFGTLVLLWVLPHVRFLVARDGDRVVGCAIGDWQDGHARVINLCVDPDARRRGIGTRLLRALEAALPMGNVLLMVEERNTVAQALYRREGYVPVGTAGGYYGRGQDGVWMQKQRTDRPAPKLRF